MKNFRGSVDRLNKIDIYSNNKNFRLHDEFIPYNWNYPSNVYRAVL
jgi:hypothetical protein